MASDPVMTSLRSEAECLRHILATGSRRLLADLDMAAAAAVVARLLAALPKDNVDAE